MTLDYNITESSSCESIRTNINGQLCQGFIKKDEKNGNQHELEMKEKKHMYFWSIPKHTNCSIW